MKNGIIQRPEVKKIIHAPDSIFHRDDSMFVNVLALSTLEPSKRFSHAK
jgi:hypothetical protein